MKRQVRKKLLGVPVDFVKKRVGRSVFDNYHELSSDARLKSWESRGALERIVERQGEGLSQWRKDKKMLDEERKKNQFMKDPVYSAIIRDLEKETDSFKISVMHSRLGSFHLGRVDKGTYKRYAELHKVKLPRYNRSGHEIHKKNIKK